MSLDYREGDLWAEIPVAGPRSEAAMGGGIRAGISLRAAGDMDFGKIVVLPFRGRLLELLGVAPDRAYAVRQVHSLRVESVDGRSPESLALIDADGLVAGATDALLTVTVADCLPVFLFDPVGGAMGIVHSGWKGTGIAAAALALMTARYGTRPSDVRAAIGPGIGPCCYRVSPERAEAFAAGFGADAVVWGPDGSGGEPRLDLRQANLSLLRRAGVEDVAVVDDCTCCADALGSFRREGGAGFTRMLAFIGGRICNG